MKYLPNLWRMFRNLFSNNNSVNTSVRNIWEDYLKQEPLSYLNVKRTGNKIITTFKDKEAFLNWARQNPYMPTKQNIQNVYSSLIEDFNRYSQELYNSLRNTSDFGGLEVCVQ